MANTVTDLRAANTVSFPSSDSAKRTYTSLQGGSVLGHFNNLNKVAIPALALLALSNLPTASGLGLWALCVAGCAASGPTAPICIATICTPLLLAP